MGWLLLIFLCKRYKCGRAGCFGQNVLSVKQMGMQKTTGQKLFLIMVLKMGKIMVCYH